MNTYSTDLRVLMNLIEAAESAYLKLREYEITEYDRDHSSWDLSVPAESVLLRNALNALGTDITARMQ